jgi:hypothetical protein
MRAHVGDHLRIHSRAVGVVDREGEVIEVHGDQGEPPYLVRFEDGKETLIFPGPDCTVEQHKPR